MESATIEPAVPAAGSGSERRSRERRFYCRMALAVAVAVFLGFAPSFYLKPFGIVHFPRPEPALNTHLMFHGLVFSLWVAIFIVQTRLVAAGRRDLHRRLGVAGFALVALMVPVMYVTVLDEVARNSGPPFTDVLTWTAVPLVPIPFYVAVLLLGARAVRRDLQAHKRFMLGLMIMLAQPAISRLPLAPPSVGGFFALSLVALSLMMPLLLWDRRTRGGVHPATGTVVVLFAALIVLQTLFLALPGVWRGLVVHLPGFAV